MAEVMNMPVDSLDGHADQKENKSADEAENSTSPQPPPPPPPSTLQQQHPPRRGDRDSRERRDERDADRPLPHRGGDYHERNQSPPPPTRDRGYKRRGSSSPPPYRDRRRSPSPSPSYKRSRRDDGGYDGRRGGHRGGFRPGDRRFGYDHGGGYDRDIGGRYGDDRGYGRHMGRGGYPAERDTCRGGYGDAPAQREGLMSYKQFIQELEDDILPSEAERRYQEYRTEYITTQKRAYFDAHKDEEWLKEKYHPTNLVSFIERRNEGVRNAAKDFLLDLQSGSLDIGPNISGSASNKSGQASDPNSDEDAQTGGKRRRYCRGPGREPDLSTAPKAHPLSSELRRVQLDIEQAQALVRKLDSEKRIEENILAGSNNDKMNRDKSHGSSGPVVIVRGLTSVKGLEGIELLDTLITYLWRIHGLDYYGMIETCEPKGLRHVRGEGKGSDNGLEWEKNLDTRWQERLMGQDPLEVRTAKDKLDAAATEFLDPHVRKIRDEKYGCGAKGCTKLFHAAEFVHKHLKLKHTDLVLELTSKLRDELYFENYMNDPDAPGGTSVMQQTLARDRMQRRRGLEGRLRDDRGLRHPGGDLPSNKDGGQEGGTDGDDPYDSFGGPGIPIPVPQFGSDIPPPPVLMPVPGAGPLGPFVPAPPEVAMQMFREHGGPPQFEGDGGGRNGRSGPAPIIGSFPGFKQDPRRLRSYQDLDVPEDEVTVIDYRSL